MVTHKDARILVQEGFRRCYGTEPTLVQAQCVQAIGVLETSYGQGWSKAIPGAFGSNNIGAVTAGAEWSGATFEHKDSYPDSAGVNHWYTTKFRAYPSLADGFADLVNIVYIVRPAALAAATRGDVYGFSAALYASHYYLGFGKTDNERIAHHHAAVMAAIAAQCKELHEAPPHAFTALELSAIAQSDLTAFRLKQSQAEAMAALAQHQPDYSHSGSDVSAFSDSDPPTPPDTTPRS